MTTVVNKVSKNIGDSTHLGAAPTPPRALPSARHIVPHANGHPMVEFTYECYHLRQDSEASEGLPKCTIDGTSRFMLANEAQE